MLISGICYTMTAIDTDVSAVQKMFDVNVFGPMRMVHHFHKVLIDSGSTIVNIGSIGGIIPYVYGCELQQAFLLTSLIYGTSIL
jgi:1-acylglycerone phosphate reductase